MFSKIKIIYLSADDIFKTAKERFMTMFLC